MICAARCNLDGTVNIYLKVYAISHYKTRIEVPYDFYREFVEVSWDNI